MLGFKRQGRDLLMSFNEDSRIFTAIESRNDGISQKDLAIKVNGLSKCYQIYETPIDRLKQFLLPRIQKVFGLPSKCYYKEFWAVNDVSFDVMKGETVGIIGRNGSGKSTLLQMICGTLNPTLGNIETNGRVAALLELGAGFNPEFTGRENVYLNASVLGLTKKQIDEKFQDIVDFADIGEFIDRPVKTYSSGMIVRLAFSVQSQVDPDILIVDEALAVGDAKFQAKCFERLRQLKMKGTSILLVTHSGEQIVTHCTKAVLLNAGVQIAIGEPKDIVNRYMDLLFGKDKALAQNDSAIGEHSIATSVNEYGLSINEDAFCTRKLYNEHEYRWGDGKATILDFYLASNGVEYPTSFITGEKIFLALTILFKEDLIRPILGVTIKTKEGVTVYGANSETLESRDIQALGQAGSVAHLNAEFFCSLAPGDYFISLGVATKEGEEVIPHDRRYDSIHIVVQPTTFFFGLTNLELKLNVK